VTVYDERPGVPGAPSIRKFDPVMNTDRPAEQPRPATHLRRQRLPHLPLICRKPLT
jgi:hypothetical protein